MNWWMYLERLCDYCGESFVSPNESAKHCSRSCALKHRTVSEETKSKLSRAALKQWETDREALMVALNSRDTRKISLTSQELWKNPVFRQKIQAARKAAGYPDPNRPEQVMKRKLRAAIKCALHRTLRHLQLPKIDHTYKLMGYTGAELRVHLEKQFVNGMTWDNYGEWEIDHIRPIASFPIGTCISEINALSNLQPLWKRDNRKKWKYVKLSSNT